MLVYFLELLTKTKTTKKLGAQGLVKYLASFTCNIAKSN